MTPAPLRPALGIGLKLGATLAFTGMSAMIKLVAARYPTGEIVFYRSFFAFAPLLAWLAWRGEMRFAARTTRPLGHLRRSLAGVFGMALTFTGLSYLPLPDATALSYAAPLATVLLAVLLLGEDVRAYRLTAVAVGFGGVLLMLSPLLGDLRRPLGGAGLGALASLAAAFCSAFAVIEIRRMAATETPSSIVFYFCLACSLAGLATWPLSYLPSLAGAVAPWRAPDLADGALLIGLGLIGGIGQILVTLSYRHAEASTIAPFDYASMLWAIGLGYALFGDVPAPAVLAGAAVVIASGVFVLWRERELGIARSAAERTAPPRA